MNYRLVAIQLGDLLKYDRSTNEVYRIAEAVFRFPREDFPNDSITSQRAQLIYDWILSLAKQEMKPEIRNRQLIQFCHSLAPEGKRQDVYDILATAGFENIIVPQAATASIFGDVDIQPEEDLCFVLMPFGDDILQQVYEVHIKPTVERVGLQCKRADDILGPTPIMEDIWKGISSARVVLAELTGQNPNVFYELGLCHAIGKDAILMAQDIKWVPFDVRHRRTIIYTSTPRGCQRLEEVLQETLETVLGKMPAE